MTNTTARQTAGHIGGALVDGASMASALASGAAGLLLGYRLLPADRPHTVRLATAGAIAVVAAIVGDGFAEAALAPLRRRATNAAYPMGRPYTTAAAVPPPPDTLDGALDQVAQATATDAAERAATHAWVLDQGDDFLRASARWRGYPDGTATFYLAPGAVLHYRSTPADYGTDKEFTLLTSDADAPVRVTTLLQLHQVLADRAAGHPAPDDAPADTDLADAPDQPDQPDEVGEPESVTAA